MLASAFLLLELEGRPRHARRSHDGPASFWKREAFAEDRRSNLEEQHTEDRQLDAGDDADEDRDQSRDPTRRAVDSVKKLMKKKRLLGDEGYEQEILDSLPGDEEEIPGQQSKALEKAKRANAEAKADEPDEELREMIEAQGLNEDDPYDEDADDDEDDDGMGPGLRHGGLSH